MLVVFMNVIRCPSDFFCCLLLFLYGNRWETVPEFFFGFPHGTLASGFSAKVVRSLRRGRYN